MANIALITAAGSGTRMGLETPKQFIKLNDKPLLAYTIERFNNHKDIDLIAITTNEEYINLVKEIVNKYSFKKVKIIAKGGDNRQNSVFNGLKEIKKICNDNDVILIHDAARMFIDNKVISDNILASKKYDAIVTAIKMIDTTVSSKDGLIIDTTLNRDELYQIQTPQTFKLSLIYSAHEKYQNESMSDDSQLVKKLGKDVHIVLGGRNNFKITTIDDLKLAEALIKLNQ